MNGTPISLRRRRPSEQANGGLSRRAWSAVSALLAVAITGNTLACAATDPTIVLASDTDANSLGHKWAGMIYAEASRRLGITIQLTQLPMARRGLMEDFGEVDGDVGRSSQYGAEHPNLLRVEEPWSELSFGLYAADPALRLQDLKDLAGSQLTIEYRRGVLYCETQLKPLHLKRLSDITSEDQGMRKLVLKRSDLYCDVDIAARKALNAPALRSDTTIRKVLDLGTLPIHTYLHRKHADLATRLSVTFKAMKAEGLMDKFRLQAERDLGWTR